MTTSNQLTEEKKMLDHLLENDREDNDELEQALRKYVAENKLVERYAQAITSADEWIFSRDGDMKDVEFELKLFQAWRNSMQNKNADLLGRYKNMHINLAAFALKQSIEIFDDICENDNFDDAYKKFERYEQNLPQWRAP